MSSRPVRYTVYAQLVFFSSLLVQIVLRPDGLIDNSGVSYYSVIRATIAPYVIGFVLTAYFLWRSTESLPTTLPLANLGRLLRFCAILLICLTATPDIAHSYFSSVHVVFGSLLFITELATGIWLVIITKPSVPTISLVSIQTLAGVVCVLSIVDLVPWQIEGQIIFQIAFGWLLVRSTGKLLATVPISN